MSDPYRDPAVDLTEARDQLELARERYASAEESLAAAKRCHRAIWSPRIFAAVVGLGVAVAFASSVRTCAAWVVAPSPEAPCEEDALKLGDTRHACHNGARLELADGIARCVCPRDGGPR